jgi:O-acetyl-ADP-ribose deacetylase (regulator of RNase III)
MQSIAMPLIGHGVAGWPAKLAAQIHVEQVLRFFNSRKASPSLKV